MSRAQFVGAKRLLTVVKLGLAQYLRQVAAICRLRIDIGGKVTHPVD